MKIVHWKPFLMVVVVGTSGFIIHIASLPPQLTLSCGLEGSGYGQHAFEGKHKHTLSFESVFHSCMRAVVSQENSLEELINLGMMLQ